MTLPDEFQFSQGSLQDFVDCHRRFELRYLLQLAWPAVEAEPILENERYLRQGALFHRMVQQHLLGIPAERLSAMAQDGDLWEWWDNYREHAPGLVGKEDLAGLYPETSLSASLAGYNLVAKCDLILVGNDGRATILDWKTSRKRPRRTWLAKRLQTRVYPYLLVQAGAHLNGGEPFQPEQVEMVYWFAGFPQKPERFAYSDEQYQADQSYLAGLIEDIRTRDEGKFPLTKDERQCRFCVYRSLCDRGVKAGNLQESGQDMDLEGELEVALDFEQIAEIEF